MKPILTFALLLGTLAALGQHNYIPLNARINAYIPLTGTHSGIWPARLDQNGVRELSDSLSDLYVRQGWWSESWWGRKLSHEHLVQLKGTGMSLYIDPVLLISGGGQFGEERKSLMCNTRGFRVQGALGSQFTFESSLMESQIFVPEYMDHYINQYQVVPGEGIARRFYGDGWDHRWATGNISFTPSQWFNFSLGQGSFFYGEGYRSMMLSDNALNYPYFRVETTFGPFKYVNLWTQMYDIRPDVNLNPGNRRKWMSSHYLSWNVTDRLNVSFFEAIILGSDSTNGGMDAIFFNPVIFYRPIEDQIDSRLGNALIGVGSSYHFPGGSSVYGQFVIDEFNLRALRESAGSWLNKFAYQLGYKYRKQWGQLRYVTLAEINVARPFTYTHRDVLTNYAHFNQPIAHPLGTDFTEFVYRNTAYYGRWTFETHLSLANQGIPLTDGGVRYANGADIWTSYNNRNANEGYDAGGKPGTDIVNIRVGVSWLVQSAWNMELFTEWGYRSGAYPEYIAIEGGEMPGFTNQWMILGLRTRLFRAYSDI